MNDKELLDINDWNKAFEGLNLRFSLLQKRFLAVAMDYQHFIDNSWGQEEIYELRDNVTYRLFCSKFHIELLLQHHLRIKHHLNKKYKNEPEFFSRQYLGTNPLYDHYSKEISAIFDSTIYHAVSAFDYISILCNYICGTNKQAKIKWTQLARSARDQNNQMSKSNIALLIDNMDREFVGKLYNHRSHIIHKKSDLNRYSITMSFGKTELDINPQFLTGDSMIKEFNELRELNKTKEITVIYSSFWVLNRTIDKITDILFGLKAQMENNPKVSQGHIVAYDKQSKKMKPASTGYWNEEKYKKSEIEGTR